MREDHVGKGINDRKRYLESMLGPAEKEVVHSPFPLHLGGFSDVLVFRNYLTGFAYVTCDLISSGGQVPTDQGAYELMICTRQPSQWAAQVVSRLGRYTFDAAIYPGETMDIGPAVPKGSTVSALMFAEPPQSSHSTAVRGVLLCIGITAKELRACHQGRAEELIGALMDAKVFPFTDLSRQSVL